MTLPTRMTIDAMARVINRTLPLVVGKPSANGDEGRTPVLLEILRQLEIEHPDATERQLTTLLIRELTERIPRPRA